MKKTFKTLTALFATATLAFGLTACNDKEPAKDGAKTVSSLEQIQKDGKVRIGVFSDKPPFGYVDAPVSYTHLNALRMSQYNKVGIMWWFPLVRTIKVYLIPYLMK